MVVRLGDEGWVWKVLCEGRELPRGSWRRRRGLGTQDGIAQGHRIRTSEVTWGRAEAGSVQGPGDKDVGPEELGCH